MSEQSRRILIVHPGMECGGSERVLAALSAGFAERGHSVTILVFGKAESFYQLHQQVGLISLKSSNPLTLLYRLRAYCKQERPHVLISFLTRTSLLSLISVMGLEIPVLLSERSDPLFHPPGKMWRVLRRILYPFTAVLVAQTQRAAAAYKYLGAKVKIIPNPLPVQLPPAKQHYQQQLPLKIAACGRLTGLKGFSGLISSLQQLNQSFPGVELHIWGSGPDKAALLEKARQLSQRVHIHEPGPNLHEELLLTDMFVLCSRYEGFPNALTEALALGLPVLAFDRIGGVSELITHEKNGLLVPQDDFTALASGILRLCENPAERKMFGNAGVSVREQLRADKIQAQWENILREIKKG